MSYRVTVYPLFPCFLLKTPLTTNQKHKDHNRGPLITVSVTGERTRVLVRYLFDQIIPVKRETCTYVPPESREGTGATVTKCISSVLTLRRGLLNPHVLLGVFWYKISYLSLPEDETGRLWVNGECLFPLKEPDFRVQVSNSQFIVVNSSLKIVELIEYVIGYSYFPLFFLHHFCNLSLFKVVYKPSSFPSPLPFYTDKMVSSLTILDLRIWDDLFSNN